MEMEAEYYHIYYNSSLLVVGKGSFVEEYFWKEKKIHDEQFCFTMLRF